MRNGGRLIPARSAAQHDVRSPALPTSARADHSVGRGPADRSPQAISCLAAPNARHYNFCVAKSRDPYTLVFVSEPGAPARHLSVPRSWPLLLGFISLLSLSMSLLAGRKVRAWFDEGAARIAQSDLAAMALAGYSLRSPLARPAKTSDWPARTSPVYSLWSNSPLPRGVRLRRLRLFDVNSKRSVAVLPFTRDGLADPQAFGALREFMRCRRTGHTMDMNPALIQMLLRISQRYGASELQIISAHRLADGVVTNETSQHNRGTAADIRVAGVDVEELSQTAKDLGAGGVGTYYRHQFVHVDVREKRYFWRESTAAKEPLPAEAALEGDDGEERLDLPAADAEPVAAPEAEPAAAEAPAAALPAPETATSSL
jgi:uncharacterized protein YcbK (DUF882 family)